MDTAKKLSVNTINEIVSRHEVFEYHPGAIVEFVRAIEEALTTPAAADAPAPVALTDERKLPASHYLIDPSVFTVAPWDPTPWMIACGESASAGGLDIGAAYKAMLAGGQMHPAMMAESPFIVGGTALVGGDLAASQPAPVTDDERRALIERLSKRTGFWSMDGVRWYGSSEPDADCRRAAELLAAPVEAQAVPDIPEAIAKIIQNLHTQDNRITDSPLFGVQQRRRIYGLESDWADGHVYIDDEGIERPAKTAGSRKVYFKEGWEFVTGGLTEAGCQAYIDWDGHNLNEPRIYAYGSYRNAEWKALRSWLMSLRAAAPTPSKGEAGHG